MSVSTTTYNIDGSAVTKFEIGVVRKHGTNRRRGTGRVGSGRKPPRPQNRASHSKKPFCKVCFDAGKPESEYTGHWVRDQPGPKGTVVCPHLLSLECRYCHKKGHTPKHCTILLARRAPPSKHPSCKVSSTDSNNTWSVIQVGPSLKPSPAPVTETLSSQTQGMFAELVHLTQEPEPEPEQERPLEPKVQTKTDMESLRFAMDGAWIGGPPRAQAAAYKPSGSRSSTPQSRSWASDSDDSDDDG